MLCQRCKTGEVSWTHDTVKLIGGVHAHLCADCLTAGDGIVKASPLWDRVLILEARDAHLSSRADAGDAPTEREWADLFRDRDALDREFRLLSLEFVQPIAIESAAD
jgi:hypothetical protein